MLDRMQQQPTAAKRVKLSAFLLVTVFLLTGFVTTKTTYVIHDGSSVTTVTTYSDSLEEAYTRADVTLGATDRVRQEREGTSIHVYITRASRAIINVDGIWQSTLAYEQTVGELLAQQGISLAEDDLVSVPLDTVITDGTTIAVTRRTVTTETQRYEIPYETQRVANPELAIGTEQVLQAGIIGEGEKTFQVVTYTSGDPVRTELSDIVLTDKVDEIIEYGTKVNLHPLSVSANAIITNMPAGQGGTLTMTDGSSLSYSKHISATATAYYAGSCGKSTSNPAYGITATGTRAKVGTVAVDPKVIPYGTKMYIVTSDGTIIYGIATAEDCGGAIKGSKVDLYFDTANECFSFGRRTVEIYILE